MLSRLGALYGDLIGRWTEPETTPGGDPPRRAEEPGDDASAERSGTATAERDVSTSFQEVLDGERVSRGEVGVELGLQPHEFLAWLVRYSGGRAWQTELVETTGWSKSTVSRYLDSLESNGVVERVRIGRRKLVGVPGRMPDAVPPSGDPPDGSPADVRSREVDGPA